MDCPKAGFHVLILIHHLSALSFVWGECVLIDLWGSGRKGIHSVYSTKRKHKSSMTLVWPDLLYHPTFTPLHPESKIHSIHLAASKRHHAPVESRAYPRPFFLAFGTFEGVQVKCLPHAPAGSSDCFCSSSFSVRETSSKPSVNSRCAFLKALCSSNAAIYLFKVASRLT